MYNGIEKGDSINLIIRNNSNFSFKYLDIFIYNYIKKELKNKICQVLTIAGMISCCSCIVITTRLCKKERNLYTSQKESMYSKTNYTILETILEDTEESL